MPCQVTRDGNLSIYTVPEVKPTVGVRGRKFPFSPEVQAWWQKDAKGIETLVLRQEPANADKADVITLTLGQAYDLLHAIAWAIKGT